MKFAETDAGASRKAETFKRWIQPKPPNMNLSRFLRKNTKNCSEFSKIGFTESQEYIWGKACSTEPIFWAMSRQIETNAKFCLNFQKEQEQI